MPAQMAPLSGWSVDPVDIRVNGDYVVATFTMSGQRKGKKVNLRGAHIMRLNNQDALDEFFSV